VRGGAVLLQSMGLGIRRFNFLRQCRVGEAEAEAERETAAVVAPATGGH